MKIEKLMGNKPTATYEVKLGNVTLFPTNNEKDAKWYLQSIKQSSPDAYLAKDGVRVPYVTRSGLRVYPLI